MTTIEATTVKSTTQVTTSETTPDFKTTTETTTAESTAQVITSEATPDIKTTTETTTSEVSKQITTPKTIPDIKTTSEATTAKTTTQVTTPKTPTDIKTTAETATQIITPKAAPAIETTTVAIKAVTTVQAKTSETTPYRKTITQVTTPMTTSQMRTTTQVTTPETTTYSKTTTGFTKVTKTTSHKTTLPTTTTESTRRIPFVGSTKGTKVIPTKTIHKSTVLPTSSTRRPAITIADGTTVSIPTDNFGIIFDPKAKFNIDDDVPEMPPTENAFNPKALYPIDDMDVVDRKVETVTPAFRPVDNRRYPINRGQHNHDAKKEKVQLVPVCFNVVVNLGQTGLQCYYIEKQVQPLLESLSPNQGQPFQINLPVHFSSSPAVTNKPSATPQVATASKPNVLHAQLYHRWSTPNTPPNVNLEMSNSNYNLRRNSAVPNRPPAEVSNSQKAPNTNVIILQGRIPSSSGQITLSANAANNFPNFIYKTYNRYKRSLTAHHMMYDANEDDGDDDDGYDDPGMLGTSDEEDADGITVAFVFDTTGSMGPELQQVKEQATKIANSMLDNPGRPIYDYVFVPFHDEIIPNAPTRTRDHNHFINVIRRVKVKNGGDCPEKCLGGLLKAINISRPYSPIYVFTDAYAKDYHLEEEIIYLIQRKHPQIFFLTTGVCKEDEELFNVYRRIAATSSGHVFQTGKQDIEEVLKYVRTSLKKGKVLLSSVNSNTPAKIPYNVAINVDKSLKEFTVTASGQNTKINLLNPQGNVPDPNQIRPILDLNNVKVINVQEPEPGIWTVIVKSSSPYSVVSTGLSTINFVYGFSILKTENIGETSKRPLKSAGNYLVIKATDTTNLKNVTEVKIISLRGSVLGVVPMNEIESEKGTFSGGPTVPPNEYFKLEINGLACDDSHVKRVTTAAISPQLPEKPFITLKEEVVVKIGRSYNLTCSIESLVPVSVKLFKYGNGIVRPIFYNQTTDIVLTFDKVSLSDEGTYVCWAKNVAGIEVRKCQIRVIATPPVVKVNDVMVTRSGETSRIPCLVDSAIQFKIIWYKSKTSRDNFYRNDIVPLDNRTYEETTLVLPSTEISDQGWYICIATNEAGEGRGETYLTVEELPIIMTPDTVAFQTGNNISLECYIIKGNPVPKLLWSKNNYPVQNTYNTRLENRNLTTILSIYTADKSDEGIYKCDAVNTIGKATRDVHVIHQEPPQITAPIKDVKVIIGRNLKLECTATGYPTPEIYWEKNGQIIKSADANMIKPDDNTLTITKVNISNNGQYYCVAKNVIGSSKDGIKVLVGVPPKIYQQEKEKNIEIGTSGRLYCHITTAYPKAAISWRHNNVIIDNADKYYIDIKEAKLKDAGVYQCDAENTFGKVENNVIVTVTGAVAPIIKKNGTPEVIKHVIGDHVELSCPVAQGNPAPNITWYMNGSKVEGDHNFMLNKGTIIINQMTAKHVGEYECLAENQLGTDKKQLWLKLYEPPKIDASALVNFEVLEGSDVRFMCNVTGDPVPLVIWSRLSGPYNYLMRGHKEDITNNLYFTGVTAEDIGKYVCRAKNIAGIAKQEYALNVIVPPRIVKWPAGIEVEVGNVVQLHCNVYSLPKAAISWLKDNSTLFKPNSIYGPYLRFYATSLDRGKYSCVAENKGGVDRADVDVRILESPVIIATPQKIDILKGGDLSVHCAAKGTPEPEIVWHFQGQIVTNPKGRNHSNHLHIENVSENQNGVYTCIATNKVGNTRQTLEVGILESPSIKRWDNVYKVVPGEEVTISCEVTGEPVPHLSWYKDGQPLAEHFFINKGKIRFNAEKYHSGEYTCRAVNRVGNDSTSLTLIILERPIFARHLPNSLDILLGESVDLPCVAFGDPKPSILWSKTNYPEPIIFEARYIPFDNGTLRINNVTNQDEATYECKATNKAGSVVRQVKLNILEKPKVKLSTKSTTIHEGKELILDCESSARPAPKISWLKDGNILHYASNNNTLRLIARSGDSGLYTCMAENIVGKEEASIDITVYVAPIIYGAKEESVIGLKGETIVLKCRTQGIPEPTLIWRRNNTEVVYTRNHYRIVNDSLIMQNLTVEMTNIYVCEAKNIVGSNEKSFIVNVHARPEIVDDINSKITLVEGDDHHITCTVIGVPTPRVYWQYEEEILFNNYNNGEIVVTQDNTLVLANVKTHSAGTYQCIASNIHGETSKSYSVQVVSTRLIDADVHHVEINASDTGTLSCPLDKSLPVTKVVWLKDDEPLGNIMHERADDVHFSITIERELKITEAFPEDTGNYTCIGFYPSGSASFDILVDVLIRPQFIDDYPPQVYTVKEGESLKIDCQATGHPAPKVNWKYLDDNLPITEVTTPGINFNGENKEVLTFSSVKSSNQGKYSCTAANKLGNEKRTFQIIVIGEEEVA